MALSQSDIDIEVSDLQDAYDKAVAEGAPVQNHPPRDYAPYRSSVLRYPKQPLVAVSGGDPETVELSGPVFGVTDITDIDSDLTIQHQGEPLGERITVSGRLLDRDGRPVRGQLIELWQANASGRYAHLRDQHPAPLDPNFTGVGRLLTDDQGRYRFTTIKPGAYPWRNHTNAWRPAHIHFSVFGTAFTQRLVTQMYFPNDPLFRYDPILRSVTDEAARNRLVAEYNHDLSQPEFSLGYEWDIVLDGPSATWIEEGRD
ncbi:protocatechuate 3,4-dioxygenase subunit beta [Streptomyces turgidiscabies]|uniref:Protocatechuate 3,4-dioxygenase, beta subunit n=1 Tax=Streptomyces turgidiscabies (strain Car8) TaxID=698760 RepID=L7FF73_STRT8|nr:protocatechuate 3,4-dioxygenase subunit beta [Streptomyces turgidiscabies]ELP69731.1 protocatechuate 3,4-dioxygenase, beta subunit [Streptomyces turgidiscabies Car8]MDX3491420.1 protocatechuate 3,4-dioxygenase subunit beta [Streptomyces turgidiscabies]GAQ73898.1 protocatechuate 3,4-dioxygenase beta chain [Streptomyces turgidiscabies]